MEDSEVTAVELSETDSNDNLGRWSVSGGYCVSQVFVDMMSRRGFNRVREGNEVITA